MSGPGPGHYVRTEEIRARNRASYVAPRPCSDDCTCGRHDPDRRRRPGAPPCPEGCGCGKHARTEAHNTRIGASVQLTWEARKRAGELRGTYQNGW